MKKKWFRQLDLADEQYLAEADPARQVIEFREKRRPVAFMAACACLALILCGVWLFMPFYTVPPSTNAYVGSEYHAVIKELNMLTWEKPDYANNFEKLTSAITGMFSASKGSDEIVLENMQNGAVPDAGRPMEPGDGLTPPGSTGTTSKEESNYQEVTDNQVEGVTEADRIKRSDTHIYYLDDNILRIFSIAGLDSKELGHVQLLDKTYLSYMREWEFYLSADCKTATVIGVYPGATEKLCVGVISVDVSDPAAPKVKNKLEITGNYLSSRVTDGKLLLMTQFTFGKSDVNFDDVRTYVPHINGQPIPAENIILPDEANRTQYTVVIKLDENTLNVEGKLAFLSYSKDVYVSKDHIFLTHVSADIKQEGNTSVRNAMTEITCLTYSDGFEQKGSVTVRGYVKDQWSMDEYEGILRVVTTTNATTVRKSASSGSLRAEILMTATGNSNASLYCVDLEKFEIVASVEDFAPPREEVQSVRFDKETAYVCTSIEMSDPVFFFDLSDLNNITYKDTGTIEGFSTSLINFGNGYLLGIGVENWNDFKIEVYRETESGVEGLCQCVLKNTEYSPEYKSYYIDRENQLLGLGVNDRNYQLCMYDPSRYILLHFDGYNLVGLLNVSLSGDLEFRRGVYIDGFMYLFGREDFKVKQII